MKTEQGTNDGTLVIYNVHQTVIALFDALLRRSGDLPVFVCLAPDGLLESDSADCGTEILDSYGVILLSEDEVAEERARYDAPDHMTCFRVTRVDTEAWDVHLERC